MEQPGVHNPGLPAGATPPEEVLGSIIGEYLQENLGHTSEQAESHVAPAAAYLIRRLGELGLDLTLSVSKGEAQRQVEELAEKTRENAFMFLHGKFPKSYYEKSDQSHQAGGFVTLESSLSVPPHELPTRAFELYHLPPSRYDNFSMTPDSPYLLVINGVLPEVRSYYNGQTISAPSREIVQYLYSMPVSNRYDIAGRPGGFVSLALGVPTDTEDGQNIVGRIDKATKENPAFFDDFFQALYPGMVGEDTTTHIRREPMGGIYIKDARPDPALPTGSVGYDETIPF